jgi:hypothetical protein
MSKKKHSTMSVTSTNIPQSTTSIPYPITTAPYYTTTTTSPTYHPNWMEKDFHEYIAYKDRFKKFLEMREEFQKYLDRKDAFEEYLEDYNSKIDVPATLDI